MATTLKAKRLKARISRLHRAVLDLNDAGVRLSDPRAKAAIERLNAASAKLRELAK